MDADAFSLSPLLSLLPVEGDIRELQQYSSALFARFEQVLELRKSAEETHRIDEAQTYKVEETMLRSILEWLAIKPG